VPGAIKISQTNQRPFLTLANCKEDMRTFDFSVFSCDTLSRSLENKTKPFDMLVIFSKLKNAANKNFQLILWN